RDIHRRSASCVHLFHDTPTPQLYTLSLHDALPIYGHTSHNAFRQVLNDIFVILKSCNFQSAQRTTIFFRDDEIVGYVNQPAGEIDRKSTRLNSSHVKISYAVFCLKKKKDRNTRLEH